MDLNRWFGGSKQAFGAIGGAVVNALAVVLDAASILPSGLAWSLAFVGFVVFAAIVLWRIADLTRSPVTIEIAWDRQAPELYAFSWTIQRGSADYQGTITGRVFNKTHQPVIIDMVGIEFYRHSRLPFRRKPRAVGHIGETWEKYNGPMAGRRLEPGKPLVLDKKLFYASAPALELGVRPDEKVDGRFYLRLLVPDLVITQKIPGSHEPLSD